MLGKYDRRIPRVNVEQLRGALAEKRYTSGDLADAAGLSHYHTSHILRGGYEPGEMARLKIARGVERLGLDTSRVLIEDEE